MRLRCATCRVQACRHEPGTVDYPAYCPMEQETEALEAPVTLLVAKDRVTGHNPAAVLYTSHSYYSRVKG